MVDWTNDRCRPLRGVAVLALVASVLTGASGGGAAGAATAPDPEEGRRSYTGTIDGAGYRVEMPAEWNGTLVLYSHGYYPPGYPVEDTRLTNNVDTEGWLLDHGYALAASDYAGVTGYQVAQGYEDQLALLDWFAANVARPERTIATGQSMGAAITALLAERNPDRIAGAVSLCGGFDPQGTWNAGLDITYAVRALLTPGADIDLVRPDDPEEDTQLLVDAVDEAMTTDEGRARLALVASLNNIPGWWSAHEPRPTDRAERIRQQALWVRNAYVAGFAGPAARVDLEAKVGGNPSFNVGVDYRHQLARSSQTDQVREAYRAAGLDLDADLARLDGGDRILPDPAALVHMYRTSVPRGRLEVPMVTIHTVGDGGAVTDQERWYAHQARRNGAGTLLRQVYVERGQHCSLSAADEVVTLQTVLERIDTDRWPSTAPGHLNDAVAAFDTRYQEVPDLSTYPFERAVMPPAFVRFTPPRPLRPSL